MFFSREKVENDKFLDIFTAFITLKSYEWYVACLKQSIIFKSEVIII